jgi:hypothetical protein
MQLIIRLIKIKVDNTPIKRLLLLNYSSFLFILNKS